MNEYIKINPIGGSGGGDVTYPLLAPDGSAIAPSYSFTNGTNAGLFYNASTGELNLKSNNASLIINTAGNGIYSAPTEDMLIGSDSLNGGSYLQFSDTSKNVDFFITLGGVYNTNIHSQLITQVDSTGLKVIDGSIGNPSLAFIGDPTLGFYRDPTYGLILTQGPLHTPTGVTMSLGSFPSDAAGSNLTLNDNPVLQIVGGGNFTINIDTAAAAPVFQVAVPYVAIFNNLIIGDFNPYNVDIQNGQLRLNTPGNGIHIAEGTDATMGVATLVAGTIVVNTIAVTANSRIFLTHQNLGTIIVPVGVAVSSRVPGTSFTILSGDLTDTSDIAWMIVEPV